MTCLCKRYESEYQLSFSGGGRGDKNLAGESIGEDIPGGVNEQIFIYWSDFPHSTRRENPMWIGLSQYVGRVYVGLPRKGKISN